MKKLTYYINIIASILVSFNAYSQTPTAAPSKEETIKWISEKINLYGREQHNSSTAGLVKYDTIISYGGNGASIWQMVVATVTDVHSSKQWPSGNSNTDLMLNDIISVDTTNSLIILRTDGAVIKTSSVVVPDVKDARSIYSVTDYDNKFILHFEWDNTEHDFFERLFKAFQVLVRYNKSKKSKETF